MIYYCDGSGWNGEMAAFCVCDELGQSYIQKLTDREYTNNEAEYESLIWALENKCQDGDTIIMDSLLVVNQCLEKWKVKSSNLLPYSIKARGILNNKNVTLEWKARDKNLAGILLENRNNIK